MFAYIFELLRKDSLIGKYFGILNTPKHKEVFINLLNALFGKKVAYVKFVDTHFRLNLKNK